MEGSGDLPQAPAAPTSLPRPLPGAGGPKPKAARCLGLAPPPPCPPAAPSTVDPAAAPSTGDLPVPAAPKDKKKRAPRDPASTAARKRGKAVTGSMAPPSLTPALPAAAPEAMAAPSPSPATTVELEPEPVSPTRSATNALDEMPASMDNESFVNYTFGPSEEVDQEEEEGFVEPNARKGRGSNFTKIEDETLCHAWRKIGIDPIVGNEQQSSAYWNCIYELYKLLLKAKTCRTAGSLQHRFHTINADCFLWGSCLAQVDRLNPSGTNDIDKAGIAQKLFKGKLNKKSGKEGKSFTLHHCWQILENDEKWKNRPSNEIPNKKKPPTSSVGEGFIVDTDDDGSSGGGATPLSSVNRGRPEGRKKAKNKRANGDNEGYKESLDNMMEVSKNIAMQKRDLKTKEMDERREADERRVAAEERRAAAEERRAAAEERLAEIEERKVAAEEMAKNMENEQRIMFMDPSGLDEKGRAYLLLCKDQILASKGYFPNNGGNGGNGDGAI